MNLENCDVIPLENTEKLDEDFDETKNCIFVNGSRISVNFTAKFFISRKLSRVGRKVYKHRLIAFSEDHLFILREDGSHEAKSFFPLTSCSLTFPNTDSTKSNDRKDIECAFTINTSSGTSDEYECLNRTSLCRHFLQASRKSSGKSLTMFQAIYLGMNEKDDRDVLLGIGSSFLERVSKDSPQGPAYQTSLLCIEKIMRINGDKIAFIFEDESQEIYRVCNIDSLVRAIDESFHELGKACPSIDFNTEEECKMSIRSNFDFNNSFLLYVPVSKWEHFTERYVDRVLALTASAVFEIDPIAQQVIRKFSIEKILNIALSSKSTSLNYSEKLYAITFQRSFGAMDSYEFHPCYVAKSVGWCSSVLVRLEAMNTQDLLNVEFSKKKDVCGYHDLTLSALEVQSMCFSSIQYATKKNGGNSVSFTHEVLSPSQCIGNLGDLVHPACVESLLNSLKAVKPEQYKTNKNLLQIASNALTPVSLKGGSKKLMRKTISVMFEVLTSPDFSAKVTTEGKICILKIICSLLNEIPDEIAKPDAQRAIDGLMGCLNRNEDLLIQRLVAETIQNIMCQYVKGSEQKKINLTVFKAFFGLGLKSSQDRLQVILNACFIVKNDENKSSQELPCALKDCKAVSVHSVDSYSSIVQVPLLETVINWIGKNDVTIGKTVSDYIWSFLTRQSTLICLLCNVRSPCFSLSNACMLLLSEMISNGKMTPPDVLYLKDMARISATLLWTIYLSINEQDMELRAAAQKLYWALAENCTANLKVLYHTFPPGLLFACPEEQIFDQLGAPIWDTIPDKVELSLLNISPLWSNIDREFKSAELCWNKDLRKKVSLMILEEIQNFEKAQKEANQGCIVWNDATWNPPWHSIIPFVKVNRYYLEELRVDLARSDLSLVSRVKANKFGQIQFQTQCFLRLQYETNVDSIVSILSTLISWKKAIVIQVYPATTYLGNFIALLSEWLEKASECNAQFQLNMDKSKDLPFKDSVHEKTQCKWDLNSLSVCSVFLEAVKFVRSEFYGQQGNIQYFSSNQGTECILKLLLRAHNFLNNTESTHIKDSNIQCSASINILEGTEVLMDKETQYFHEDHFKMICSRLRELISECANCLTDIINIYPGAYYSKSIDTSASSGALYYPPVHPHNALREVINSLTDLLLYNDDFLLESVLRLIRKIFEGFFYISDAAKMRLVVMCLKFMCQDQHSSICINILKSNAISIPNEPNLPNSTKLRDSHKLAKHPLYPFLPGGMICELLNSSQTTVQELSEKFSQKSIQTRCAIWNKEFKEKLFEILQKLDASSSDSLMMSKSLDEVEDMTKYYYSYNEKNNFFIMPYYLNEMKKEDFIDQSELFIREVGGVLKDFLVMKGGILPACEESLSLSYALLNSVNSDLTDIEDCAIISNPLLWCVQQCAGREKKEALPEATMQALCECTTSIIAVTTMIAGECSLDKTPSENIVFGLETFSEVIGLILEALGREKYVTWKNYIDQLDLANLLGLIKSQQNFDDSVRHLGYLMKGLNLIIRKNFEEMNQNVNEQINRNSNFESPGFTELLGTIVKCLDLYGKYPFLVAESIEAIDFVVRFKNMSDVLYSSAVIGPLLVHCLRESYGGSSQLCRKVAEILKIMACINHPKINKVFQSLLTYGATRILQDCNVNLFLRLIHTPTVETPMIIWNEEIRREVLYFLEGKSRSCLEMENFSILSLKNEFSIENVYLQVLLKSTSSQKILTTNEDASDSSCIFHIALPNNLFESVLKNLLENFSNLNSNLLKKIRNVEENLKNFLCSLQVFLGLAIGCNRFPMLLEEYGDDLWVFWQILPPSISVDALKSNGFEIYMCILQFVKEILKSDEEDAIPLLVKSGIACPLLCLCAYLLDKKTNDIEGTIQKLLEAVLYVMMELSKNPIFKRNFLSIGGIPLLLSICASKEITLSTRIQSARVLHKFSKSELECSKENSTYKQAVLNAARRLIPEKLLEHFRNDSSGSSPIQLIDSVIVSPLLLWNDFCRIKLYDVTCKFWVDGWVHQFTNEKYPLWSLENMDTLDLVHSSYENEPYVSLCPAMNIYYQIYILQPGYQLSCDTVTKFFCNSLLDLKDNKVKSEYFAPLMQALYYAISSFSANIIDITKNTEEIWKIFFINVWSHLGFKSDGRLAKIDSPIYLVKSDDASMIYWVFQLLCLLLSVKSDRLIVDAASTFSSHEKVMVLLTSQKVDVNSLCIFLAISRKIVLYNSSETAEYARILSKPIVISAIHSLTDQIASKSLSKTPSPNRQEHRYFLQDNDILEAANTKPSVEKLALRFLNTLANLKDTKDQVRSYLKDSVSSAELKSILSIPPSTAESDILALLLPPSTPLTTHPTYPSFHLFPPELPPPEVLTARHSISLNSMGFSNKSKLMHANTAEKLQTGNSNAKKTAFLVEKKVYFLNSRMRRKFSLSKVE